MAKKRPLIVSKPVDEFGEVTVELDELDQTNMAVDMTYVPGWSELKYQRDAALADLAAGRCTAAEVPSLPVNVRMVRRAGIGGQSDGSKLMMAFNNGYKPIPKKHIGQAWFTALPPGAREMEDGSIVNAAGDCQYMYCEGPRAALNKRRATERMLAHADNAGLNPVDDDGTPTPGITQSGGTFGKVPLK